MLRNCRLNSKYRRWIDEHRRTRHCRHQLVAAPQGHRRSVNMLRQLELSHLQLALSPLLALEEDAREEQLDQLTAAGITLTSGMIAFPGEDYSTIARIRQ